MCCWTGAHFLLKTAQRFHKLLMSEQEDTESKELDNLVMLLGHLYTFRVGHFSIVEMWYKSLSCYFSLNCALFFKPACVISSKRNNTRAFISCR